MKMMKRITAVFLSIVLTLSLAACSSGGDKSADTAEPEEKLLDTSSEEAMDKLKEAPHFDITVMMGNFTDGQGQEVMDAMKYIEGKFNVTFNFVETSNTVENTISAIETAVASGTDGIIGACIKTAACVESAGDVPMVNQPYLGEALTDEIKDKPNYLGSICEDDYGQGYAAGQALYDAGCRNVCIARQTVGVSDSLDLRAQGFLDFVEEHDDMELLSDNQSRSQFADAVATFASAFPQMDGIYCVVANDGVLQAMTTEGLVGSVKLATVGNATQDEQYIENGTLVYCTGGKAAITISAFLVMYNYLLDGTNLVDTPDKNVMRASMDIKTTEDYQNVQKYVVGEIPPYNAEELMEMVHYFNPDFGAEQFNDFCDNYTIQDVAERRTN